MNNHDKTLYLTNEDIKKQGLNIGFHRIGIADVNLNLDQQIENKQRLQQWLDKGYQAQMEWMNNPRRQDIKETWEEAKSIISVALNYYTPYEHSSEPHRAKISRYGWGRDYHRVMSKKLKALCQWLTAQDERIKVRYYVDTGPIQDKFWAQQTGIGWVAKNGNVITKDYGSWVFLGEILINVNLTPDQPHTNHCGTCTRCLDACPTQAITEPFVVNANLCIAYHTIENRQESLPTEISSKLNGWVAGCDICQDVCPWNQRFAQVTDVSDFFPYEANVNPTLTELAQMTETQWNQRFQGSALRRIKPEMWRRNANAQIKQSQIND